MSNYSGYGAAPPLVERLRFTPWPTPAHITNVTAFALDGAPAACAHVGLSGALSDMPIDLVVSGVNAGLNLGRDAFLSSTVGATLTARILGKPAIAVSLETGNNGGGYWETASACVADLVQTLAEAIRRDSTPYSVNIPNRPLSELAGVRITQPSTVSCLDSQQIIAVSANQLQVRRNQSNRAVADTIGSDIWAIKNGFVSITRLPWLRDMQHEPLIWRSHGLQTDLSAAIPDFCEVCSDARGIGCA